MAGQLSTINHPDNKQTTRTYDLHGRVVTEAGTASYPVRYAYDELGQRTMMGTRRDATTQPFEAGIEAWDTTTWAFQPGTGLLESKTDAAGKATTYSYHPGGQLATRTWARTVPGQTTPQPLTTSYAYDPAGRLTGTDYSDDTPDVTLSLDRAGRTLTASDGSGSRTLAYEGPGRALSRVTYEPDGGGPLAGFGVAYGFDGRARRDRIASVWGAAELAATTYTYQADTARIATIGHGGHFASYDWTTQVGALPAKITYHGAGIVGTRIPDEHMRLDEVRWTKGAATTSPVLLRNDYTLDARGRRTGTAREDGVDWAYGYNDRGEVTSGTRGGQSFGYDFDDIGNRRTAASAGFEEDGTQAVAYSANSRNQYTAITNPDPGKRTVRGQLHAAATLSSTSSAPPPPATTESTTGEVKRFTTTTEAATTHGPAWRQVSIEGRRAGAGKAGADIAVRREAGFYFPPRDEAPVHDDDGNLTQDGRWDYQWDAENRLRAMETNPAAVAAGVPRQRLEFAYDSQSRRVRKVVMSFSAQTSEWSVTSDTRFLYDGWNMIAELDASPSPISHLPSPRLSASHAWGLDLSGTETGAGGVSGLVFTGLYSATQTTADNSHPPPASLLAPLYDGNGNVLAHASAQTGEIQGRYEYDPFGRLLMREEDPRIAGRAAHLFSTKFYDAETSLSYYGYRYYSAELGRWLSRDPWTEIAFQYAFIRDEYLPVQVRARIDLFGINEHKIYLFISNSPISSIDLLGLINPDPSRLGVPSGRGPIGCNCASFAVNGNRTKAFTPTSDNMAERGCIQVPPVHLLDCGPGFHLAIVYQPSLAPPISNGGSYHVTTSSSHQTGGNRRAQGTIFTNVEDVLDAAECYFEFLGYDNMPLVETHYCCPD